MTELKNLFFFVLIFALIYLQENPLISLKGHKNTC